MKYINDSEDLHKELRSIVELMRSARSMTNHNIGYDVWSERINQLFPGTQIRRRTKAPKRWVEVVVTASELYSPTPMFLASQIPDAKERMKAYRQCAIDYSKK